MITLKFIFQSLFLKDKFQYEDNIQVRGVDDSYQDLCKVLDKNKKAYFVRFGDGEIATMMGQDHRNYKYNP
ncbi:MAG: hypothetical protein MI784_11335, partial [Cytophagales bacterium]|nr:hypothetical protein [Cytophagales bacterium]